MLALSTLSGLSYASSSLSQDVDLELVEEIIQRAPRSATTFPLVYRAYGEVLEENGLSQSSDTAYYQFLLKLGVIRAPTWGERWDLWKATNSIQSRPQPHTSPRKARRVSTREATIKARVPFLASASSDLDDGFEGDGESVQIRNSPRRDLKREGRKSLVGHSPSRSIDYDFASLTAPIRTSTPVNRGRGSPPLPPYSVSDVSEGVDSETLGDTQGTPRARVRQLEAEELDADVMREMERRADEFFETGLRGRCWDVWAQASEWVQVCCLGFVRTMLTG
jgi:protein SFI1